MAATYLKKLGFSKKAAAQRRAKATQDRQDEDALTYAVTSAAANKADRDAVADLLKRLQEDLELMPELEVPIRASMNKWNKSYLWLKCHPMHRLTRSFRRQLQRAWNASKKSRRTDYDDRLKYAETFKTKGKYFSYVRSTRKPLPEWMNNSALLPKAPPGRG